MQRNISLDTLRIIACLAVIFIHTAGSPVHHHMVEISSGGYKVCMFMDALCRWSVPIFVMLTGYFLLDPNKDISINNIIKKYIPRIVISLIVWSVLYAILLKKDIFPIGSQEAHFWYLNMLIGLYLSVPILRLITLNKNVLKYFCVVWIIYQCYLFIGKYYELPIQIDSFLFVEYSGYALLGYYIKQKKLNKGMSRIVYLMGILGVVITVYMGINSLDGQTYFFGYTSPNVIFTSIAILLYFHQYSIKVSSKLSNIISEISACTYGIYLIHMYILIQVFFRVHRFLENPLLLTIICVGIAFIGGGIVIYLIRKIPYINKYIV